MSRSANIDAVISMAMANINEFFILNIPASQTRVYVGILLFKKILNDIHEVIYRIQLSFAVHEAEILLKSLLPLSKDFEHEYLVVWGIGARSVAVDRVLVENILNQYISIRKKVRIGVFDDKGNKPEIKSNEITGPKSDEVMVSKESLLKIIKILDELENLIGLPKWYSGFDLNELKELIKYAKTRADN